MREIKKILLIAPPISRPMDISSKVVRIALVPPLGLAYIASVLEKDGLEVQILDALLEGHTDEPKIIGNKIRYGLSDEEIKNKIIEFKPDLVGVSCLISNNYKDSHNICRIIKEADSEIITTMGGAHPTSLPLQTMNDTNVDFIILGEGEYTMRDLIKTLNAGDDISKLDGLVYRDKDVVKILPKTRFIENLDELPFPARHLLKMEEYSNTSSPHSGVKRKPFAAMTSSRGCPARCTFCAIRSMWGSKYRVRSAENVLEEIDLLIREYNIKEIHFEDDNLTYHKDRAMKIFNGIKERGYDLTLNSPSGLAVYALDDELLENMWEAGYYSISLAIESGDPHVLNRIMKKPVKLDRVKPLVDKARSLGMHVKGFFILGYPEESKESMAKTIEFAKGLGLDWALFFVATLLPGTEMLEMCKKNGYVNEKELDWETNFIHGNIITPQFTPEYVEKLREKANLDLNFRYNTNLMEEKWDRAIEDLSYVATLYPHLDYAHFYLGKAYEGKGLLMKAINEYEQALQLNPDHKEAAGKLEVLKK